MAKKNFKSHFDTILQNDQSDSTDQNTTSEPQTPKETRATFVVQDNLLDKIKAIAYFEREKQKTIINQALHNYIKDYEEQAGQDVPVPKK